MDSWRRAFRGGLLIAVLIAPAAAAQEVLANADGTLSIRASQVPLGRVLRAIGEVSPFERLVIDPDVEQRLVTVTLDHLSVARALATILTDADVDYVMVGLGRRLIAGDRAFVSNAQQRARGDSPSAIDSKQIVEKAELDPRDSPQVPDEPADDKSDDADVAGSTAAVAAGVPETPSDVASESRRFQLERALSPAGPRVRTGLIELPFPGPDGRPLTVVQPVVPVAPSLPFPLTPSAPAPAAPAQSSAPGAFSTPVGSTRPGMSVAPPAANPPPQVIPVVVDPKLRQLMEALAPPSVPR